MPNKREMDLVDDVLNNLFFPVLCRWLLQKKLDFIVELNTEKTRINADEYSINQIFNNLFDNAIKYTSEGGIKNLG